MSRRKKLFPVQILAMGFGLIIFLGSILLSLPVCSRDGQYIPFINGLFTSASATCVTGLAVYDTWSQFNFWGQLVILLLIQIGGLGFMGIAMTFSILIGKKVTLFQRELLMESFGALNMAEIMLTIRRMIIGTVIFEGLGAAVISARFIPEVGVAEGIWYGVFHSISAFCNAGFDLFGRFKPSGSLTLFQHDPAVQITVMILIIAGGMGFIVWNDAAEYRLKFRKYKLHSKIMLTFSLLLIVLGALAFYITEGNYAFSDMSRGERMLNAFFASVSPRTAGFNTVALEDMSAAGRFLTMMLMFIGAGPGSTGGGIKVTTFVTLFLAIYSYAKHYQDLSIFKRRLPWEVQRKAFSNIAFYMSAVLFCVFCLLAANPQLSLEKCLFEALSAMGTVGLTMGVTPNLGIFSKLCLIVLMYCGRMGSIGVAMALVRRRIVPKLSYPEENITIG